MADRQWFTYSFDFGIEPGHIDKVMTETFIEDVREVLSEVFGYVLVGNEHLSERSDPGLAEEPQS